MSPEIVRKAVADFFAAIRDMDQEAWVATFAEDAIDYDPAHAPPMRGRAELRRFFQNVAGAFAKVELIEDHVFICGPRAAVKWTGRGVGKNGREVVFEGIDVFEVSPAGKIQAAWSYWDPAAVMAQLQG